MTKSTVSCDRNDSMHFCRKHTFLDPILESNTTYNQKVTMQSSVNRGHVWLTNVGWIPQELPRGRTVVKNDAILTSVVNF